MKCIKLGIASAFLFIIGCDANVDTSSLEWLKGEWRMELHNGYLVEKWSETSDGMAAEVYRVNDGDTLHIEKITLTRDNDIWIYKADVDGQNGGTVEFRLDSLKDARFLEFHNPSHDFPNFITYKLQEEDSLIATIEDESRNRRQEFLYRKIQ